MPDRAKPAPYVIADPYVVRKRDTSSAEYVRAMQEAAAEYADWSSSIRSPMALLKEYAKRKRTES